jgi:hypothetical protein
MTWFAIHSDSREIVATGESYMECSNNAHSKLQWGTDLKGEVAPYFLTTDKDFFAIKSNQNKGEINNEK